MRKPEREPWVFTSRLIIVVSMEKFWSRSKICDINSPPPPLPFHSLKKNQLKLIKILRRKNSLTYALLYWTTADKYHIKVSLPTKKEGIHVIKYNSIKMTKSNLYQNYKLSLKYQNVVTPILGGKFLLPNLNLQCRIHVLSKHCISSTIRSWDNDRFCVLSKGCMSLDDKSFMPIRQRYLYDYNTINTFQSIS